MIYIFFGLVIIICYWALWKPECAFTGRIRRWALWLVVIGYAGLSLLATTGEKPFWSPGFIFYPLLYSVLLRSHVRRLLKGLVRSRIGQTVVVFCLLWFSEIFAGLDIASYDPLGRHMLVYIGFYVAGQYVDKFKISDTQHDWKQIWIFPCLFAAEIALMFIAFFKNDKKKNQLTAA